MRESVNSANNLSPFKIDNAENERLLNEFLSYFEEYVIKNYDINSELSYTYFETASDRRYYFASEILQNFEQIKEESLKKFISENPNSDLDSMRVDELLTNAIYTISVGLLVDLIPLKLGREYFVRSNIKLRNENEEYYADLLELEDKPLIPYVNDNELPDVLMFANFKYDDVEKIPYYERVFNFVSSLPVINDENLAKNISKRITLDLVNILRENLNSLVNGDVQNFKQHTAEAMEHLFNSILNRLFLDLSTLLIEMDANIELDNRRKAIFMRISEVIGDENLDIDDELYSHLVKCSNPVDIVFTVMRVDCKPEEKKRIEKYLSECFFEYRYDENFGFEVYLNMDRRNCLYEGLKVYELFSELDLSLNIIPFSYNEFKSSFKESGLSNSQIIKNIVCKRFRRKFELYKSNGKGLYINGLAFDRGTIVSVQNQLDKNEFAFEENDIPTTPVEIRGGLIVHEGISEDNNGEKITLELYINGATQVDTVELSDGATNMDTDPLVDNHKLKIALEEMDKTHIQSSETEQKLRERIALFKGKYPVLGKIPSTMSEIKTSIFTAPEKAEKSLEQEVKDRGWRIYEIGS